jgi:hypothetical protein
LIQARPERRAFFHQDDEEVEMWFRSLRRGWATAGGLGMCSVWAASLILVTIPAFGQNDSSVVGQLQVPQPKIPDINERSGLLDRFRLPERFLPPDRNRVWYDNTRWARWLAFNPRHPNNPCRGGLYGFPWKQTCTASYYPFFQGSPGENTLRPDCQPQHRALRLFENTFHPFRPVGTYYNLGSYVPIYDLDPWVPGPGPYPVPWFCNGYLGGRSRQRAGSGRVKLRLSLIFFRLGGIAALPERESPRPISSRSALGMREIRRVGYDRGEPGALCDASGGTVPLSGPIRRGSGRL